jgi:hypothetical protein
MSVTVSVRIPRRLRDEAKRYGINISEVARRALEEEARGGGCRGEAGGGAPLQDLRGGDGGMAEGGEEGEVGHVLDASAIGALLERLGERGLRHP